ncbi:unnamed protein product [Darwinula stevensoni]|uniref:Uncharacterized protein n=1 Tax=Darwinula stevensoni TaxID=69355 RepID=A0A7R8X6Q1_9CRUS|nr:unnamed protein product [Darwinula stevensoni]CAG0879690.1 unnamed protein product [Darwinula stevensoni]
MKVEELLRSLMVELRSTALRVRLADSLSEVDLAADVILLDGDVIKIDYPLVSRDRRGETDRRYFMTEGVWLDEREYEVALRGVEEVYGKPLKRLSSLTNEEHLAIFGGVSHISELSHLIISQLDETLKTWDPGQSRIGVSSWESASTLAFVIAMALEPALFAVIDDYSNYILWCLAYEDI